MATWYPPPGYEEPNPDEWRARPSASAYLLCAGVTVLVAAALLVWAWGGLPGVGV